METADTASVNNGQEMANVVDVSAAHRDSNLEEILSDLDRELVGLRSVKSYIRRLASLLLVRNCARRLGSRLSTRHCT